ncbi:MAG: GxxExxY protein [Candidatus Komeilibacteria bacterium]|nr:GxxExxY protein [Candidatus Komeilibacteria bacterium]
MHSTYRKDILYPQLSYRVIGYCFKIYDELFRYQREVEYADALEDCLKRGGLSYVREKIINKRNRADFVVEKKIIVEIKCVRYLTKRDFYQVQRYLQSSGMKLGLLINFHGKVMKFERVVKISAK